MFIVPPKIPSAMTTFCQNLEKEINQTNESHTIDPFSVASKFCLEFVQIHPFQDGNGRLCRMILNAILCRYTGVIVPIGENHSDRSEYMGIKIRASERMEGHGEFATFILQKATTRIRELKKKLVGKSTQRNS
jgi:Fic family protein